MVLSLLNELAATMPPSPKVGSLAKKHRVKPSEVINALRFYGYTYNGKTWILP